MKYKVKICRIRAVPEGLEDVRCGADRGRCLSGRSRRHRSRRLPRRQGSRQASGNPIIKWKQQRSENNPALSLKFALRRHFRTHGSFYSSPNFMLGLRKCSQLHMEREIVHIFERRKRRRALFLSLSIRQSSTFLFP